MRGHTIGWTALAMIALLAGCGDDGAVAPSGPDDARGQRSSLRTVGDGDAFFAELRGALVAQRVGGNGTDGADTGEEDLSAGGDDAAGAPPSNAPTHESAGDGDAREVTDTNVQEQGVDEQDRVKVDREGTRLYVLHEVRDDGRAEPFAVDDVETGEPIEGPYVPREPSTTLRILGLDADSTEATSLRDVELDLGGASAQGMYLHESESGDSVLLTASRGGYWGYWEDSGAFSGQESLLVRVDVDEPSAAAVSGRFRIDGQIVSSRRIGKHLFFASRFYPAIPGPGPYEQSAEAWREAVENADLAALLPRYGADGGEGTALVEPERCFVAPRPENDDWYTPDIVTLAVIDLDTMELADSECYLGASETLYASPDAVYLATTRWDHGEAIFVDDTDGDTVAGDEPLGTGVPYDPRVETDIHQFDIDGGTLAYRGSGSVRGHLGWSELRKPFRMSARGGVLRVATVNDTFGAQASVSPINLSVLEPDGDGALVRIAELPNERRPAPIGKPGEQLYASRFVGDRAYLVTFRQTDPLYVVDLADPRDPRVLGELEIEGYSDYLLPIDETHLLGIGRDAVVLPAGGGDGERGGFVQGVKLSLFDVSNPARPSEVESLLVGQRGTQSEALFDHRGITVQRATDSHPTRVSFGIDVAGTPLPDARPTPPEALNYYSWTHTALYGFDVHGGDGADIEHRGAMVVERAGGESGFYGPVFVGDRAVMVDDTVYYVHGPQVYVAPWNDLGNPAGPR